MSNSRINKIPPQRW